jgi:hypothetical protein
MSLAKTPGIHIVAAPANTNTNQSSDSPTEAQIRPTPAPSHLRVIRAKCVDCCAGQPGEVRKCVATTCPLWPYRMGTDPFTNRKGNPATQRPGAAHANGSDPASIDDTSYIDRR